MTNYRSTMTIHFRSNRRSKTFKIQQGDITQFMENAAVFVVENDKGRYCFPTDVILYTESKIIT